MDGYYMFVYNIILLIIINRCPFLCCAGLSANEIDFHFLKYTYRLHMSIMHMADITPSLMGWVMLMWNCMN